MDARFKKMSTLISKGKTLNQVGEIFGISRERVRQIVGSPIKYRKSIGKTRAILVEGKKDEIYSLRKNGKSFKEIEKLTGFSDYQVRTLGKLPDKPFRHGTVNGYTYHKCRCEECRDAASKYRIELYNRIRSNGR